MPRFLASALGAAMLLAPTIALAQYVIPEPPMMATPTVGGPLNEDDAATIAMMSGMAVVEDVDVRMWDGNFEVEGKDQTGEDIVMRIDPDTGEVLDIDD